MSDEKTIKVLFIDDNEVDRYTYRRQLERASPKFHIFEAHSGKQGIELAESIQPDCIVLDMLFPGEYGFEILHALVGESGGPPKHRVIVFSVLSEPFIRDGALSLGARAFLVKHHTSPEQLARSIEDVIAVP